MLDFIRNNRKTILLPLVILVVLAFVVFGGVNYNFGGSGANDLAHVGSTQITSAHFKNKMELIRRSNPEIDFRELERPEVKMQVLRGVVQDTLWQTAAYDHRLAVSGQAYLEKLVTMPELQDLVDGSGRFDVERYKAEAARRVGYRADEFMNQVLRPEIMVERMKLPVYYGFTSRVDVEQYMQFVDSRYVLKQQMFGYQQYADSVTVTPEELQARYDEYKQQFVNPARVDIEYVVFDTSVLGQSLSKDELRAYYEQNKASFSVPEQRRISHILFEGEGAEQKAKALLEELRKDSSRFGEVAKQQSADVVSSSAGGDLGYITQGMMVPLDRVAFSLPLKGDISDVVKSPFGYHIVMLTDIKGASSFEEIFPAIEADLRRRAALPLAAKAVDNFRVAVTTQNENFEAIAKELGLKIEHVQNVTQKPAAGVSGVLSNEDFLNTVFNPNALDASKNTMPVKVGATQVASARVLNYMPESIKPLSEVEDIVKAVIVQEKAMIQAQVEVQKLLEQWQANPSMAEQGAEIAFSQGEVIQWAEGARQQQIDPGVMLMLQEVFAVAGKAFEYNTASQLPVSFVVELPGRGYILAQLQSIEQPQKTDEEVFMQRSFGLGKVVTESQGNAVLVNMEKQYDVVIYPETVERLAAQ
ncbi:MAG: SurA N-terminal domain-containing protein [Saezia sp.]